MVFASGDVPLSVCMDHGDNPICMIKLIGAQFAPASTSIVLVVLSALFGNRHKSKEDMAQYID